MHLAGIWRNALDGISNPWILSAVIISSRSLSCISVVFLTLTFSISVTISSLCEASEPEIDLRRFVIGVEDVNYYPYYNFVDAQEEQGFLKQILNEFAEQHGIVFDYVALPIKRFDYWYESRQIDFRLPDNPRWHPKQKKSLIFSESLIKLPTGTVVVENNRSLPLDDFVIVGTLTGFTPSPHWLEASKTRQLEFESHHSIKSLVRLLYRNVIQGLDMDLYTVRHHAKIMGLNEQSLVLAENVPARSIDYYLSTKQHKDVLLLLNQFIKDNRANIDKTLLSYQH